jgi:uncharacterized protein YceK
MIARYILLALLLLSGCVNITQFTAADASNAVAMTKAASDSAAPIRGQCYQSWANVAGSIPAQNVGLFTVVEAGIEVNATLQLPTCQAIAGQVVLWALRHAPGGNLLP